MRKLNCLLLSLLISILITNSSYAAYYNQSKWRSWVQHLRQQALSQGIRPRLFDQIFRSMAPSPKHIRLDRNQPETRLTYYKYRNTRGDAYRIRLGRREYRRHQRLINQIGRRFGVNPCFIVSLWGLESSYGRFMGNFHVLRSLATLAYDGRRSAFFRKELLLALQMVNDGHIALSDFKGEWAGASGQSQFLPSSWYKYAIDYNMDGKKDIWKTHADIFASIANYLHSNGWRAHQPVLVTATLPHHFPKGLLGLTHSKTVAEWQRLGVTINSNQPQVNASWHAAIVKPYGGPTFMAFKNFRVLLTWNYSIYYAGTVNYVAGKICR